MLTVMHCWDLQHTGSIAVSRGNLLYCRLRNCWKGTHRGVYCSKDHQNAENRFISGHQRQWVQHGKSNDRSKSASFSCFGMTVFSLSVL